MTTTQHQKILRKKHVKKHNSKKIFYQYCVKPKRFFLCISIFWESVWFFCKTKSIFCKRRHYFEIQTHYFATVSHYFNIRESLSLSWSDTRSILQDKISIFRRFGVFLFVCFVFWEEKGFHLYSDEWNQDSLGWKSKRFLFLFFFQILRSVL